MSTHEMSTDIVGRQAKEKKISSSVSREIKLSVVRYDDFEIQLERYRYRASCF